MQLASPRKIFQGVHQLNLLTPVILPPSAHALAQLHEANQMAQEGDLTKAQAAWATRSTRTQPGTRRRRRWLEETGMPRTWRSNLASQEPLARCRLQPGPTRPDPQLDVCLDRSLTEGYRLVCERTCSMRAMTCTFSVTASV
jgi:hypothetical protein